MRQTQQRSLILEELRACAQEARHPGAEEIFLRVRKRLPRISLATVYRNLELLADMGLTRRVEVADGYRRYDGVVQPHCHFRCRVCGLVEDLPFDVLLPRLDDGHPWVRARRIEGGRPEYYGLCPDCARAERSRGAAKPGDSPQHSRESHGRVTP